MHFIFIPYGKKEAVEKLIRDMSSQKHQWKLTNPETKKEVKHWIEGQVRILPFGIYEYVCPFDDKDLVMNTLNFNQKEGDRYNLGKTKFFFLRKLVKAESIPEKIDSSQKYLWLTENVEIIPIGVRYDKMDYIQPFGEYKDWIGEAI